MNTSLTQTEQRIADMIHAMDILIQEMKTLLPAKVDSPNFKRWRELYRYREDLFEDLYNTVEDYVKEIGQLQDAEECWHEAANTLQNCTNAVDEVHKLRKEERITSEEYLVILKPLKDELHNVQRFAVSKVLEKERELSDPGEGSDPLSFIN